MKGKHGVECKYKYFNYKDGRVFCLIEVPKREVAEGFILRPVGLRANEIIQCERGA